MDDLETEMLNDLGPLKGGPGEFSEKDETEGSKTRSEIIQEVFSGLKDNAMSSKKGVTKRGVHVRTKTYSGHHRPRETVEFRRTVVISGKQANSRASIERIIHGSVSRFMQDLADKLKVEVTGQTRDDICITYSLETVPEDKNRRSDN